jgi:hypothetical protein
MKKLIALLVLVTAFLAYTPVYAEGESLFSSSGDRVSVGQDINIDKSITGNVVSIGGNVEIHDDVRGDVVVVFGDVIIDGKVAGEVVTIFGDVKMTGRASIGGNLVSLGTVERNELSRIYGQEVNLNLGFLPITGTMVMIFMLVFAFFVLLLGFPILAVFRDRFSTMSGNILTRIGIRTALGFLIFLGLTIFLPILAITLVAPLLYFVLLIAAEIITGIFLGRIITKTFNSHTSIFVEFVIGFVVITMSKGAAIILFPQVGLLVSVLAYLLLSLFINSFGLGTLLDTKFGTLARK